MAIHRPFVIIILSLSMFLYDIHANPLTTIHPGDGAAAAIAADEAVVTTTAEVVGAAAVASSQETVSESSHNVNENNNNNREGRNVDNELSKTNAMEEMFLKKLSNKCSNKKDMSSCVMLKLMNYMNRLLKKSSLEISDSIEISQTSSAASSSAAEQPSIMNRDKLEMDETSRSYSEESMFTELISGKLWNFLKSRSLKWKLLPEAAVVLSTTSDEKGNLNLGVALRSSRSIEEGRGKMKNMGPIIAAGIMKIGMLKVLAFKALALLVGKALLVSKLAFLLAAIIGLRKLFSQQRHVTYEVVAHPHHTHSSVESHGHGGGDSYSSGWGRSGGDAQTLAYRGHLQK